MSGPDTIQFESGEVIGVDLIRNGTHIAVENQGSGDLLLGTLGDMRQLAWYIIGLTGGANVERRGDIPVIVPEDAPTGWDLHDAKAAQRLMDEEHRASRVGFYDRDID